MYKDVFCYKHVTLQKYPFNSSIKNQQGNTFSPKRHVQLVSAFSVCGCAVLSPLSNRTDPLWLMHSIDMMLLSQQGRCDSKGHITQWFVSYERTTQSSNNKKTASTSVWEINNKPCRQVNIQHSLAARFHLEANESCLPLVYLALLQFLCTHTKNICSTKITHILYFIFYFLVLIHLNNFNRYLSDVDKIRN